MSADDPELYFEVVSRTPYGPQQRGYFGRYFWEEHVLRIVGFRERSDPRWRPHEPGFPGKERHEFETPRERVAEVHVYRDAGLRTWKPASAESAG